MLKSGFKTMWNRAVLFMGVLWAVLVFMIWESGQLPTADDRRIFLTVVAGGFIVVYISGFVIEARNRKKKAEG